MRYRHGTAFPHGSLSASFAFYRKTFLTIQPLKLLVVHDASFSGQHDSDTPSTKSSTIDSDLTHALAYLGTVRDTSAANSFGIDADQVTSSSLGDVVPCHRP
jgi:hypothetical protein